MEEDLLFTGYIRENEVILRQIIPDSILDIIRSFCLKFLIFGAGNNNHGGITK